MDIAKDLKKLSELEKNEFKDNKTCKNFKKRSNDDVLTKIDKSNLKNEIIGLKNNIQRIANELDGFHYVEIISNIEIELKRKTFDMYKRKINKTLLKIDKLQKVSDAIEICNKIYKLSNTVYNILTNSHNAALKKSAEDPGDSMSDYEDNFSDEVDEFNEESEEDSDDEYD